MGLLKTAAKVAVASSVHGRVQRRQQNRWAEQDARAQQPPAWSAQPEAAPPPVVAAGPPPAAHAPAAPSMSDNLALLAQLGDLRTAGVLTDAEFEVKKAQILAP